MNKAIPAAALALFAAGCENPDLDGDAETKAIDDVKAYVTGQISALNTAAVGLQTAAPAGDADGWNSGDDTAAVNAMKLEWKKARGGYERVEGAIAVLFPDLDASTDERYDGFIAEGADDNLFDDEGVTGVHAIERILFSDSIPEEVVTFESGLGANYVAARFPENAAEATDFKTRLTQKLIDDTAQMQSDFGPVALGLETAYRGVLGSMEEQIEKVSLAGSGEDESRYAQHTLADMRFNLEGGKAIFAAFEDLFAEQGDDGEALYKDIFASFERAQAAVDAVAGDAIPPVPETWNPDAPSAVDAASEYGTLFLFFANETDPENADGFVALFTAGADLLSIPQLAE